MTRETPCQVVPGICLNEPTFISPGGLHRMKSLLRIATIATASLALVGGTTVGATASDESVPKSVSVAPLTAAPEAQPAPSWSASMSAQAVGDATITSIRVNDGVLHRAGGNFTTGITQYTGLGSGDRVFANILDTSNRVRGTAELHPNGAAVPSTSGAGKRRLANVRIHYADGAVQAVAASSNYFVLRSHVKFGGGTKIYYSGKKKKVRVRGVKIFNPANGQYKSLGRVKLQYKSGSKWKTKKTIKLNSSGNGSYKFSKKKKYRYRLYSPATSTSTGLRTIKTSKI